MRKFILEMEGMYVGEKQERQIKNANKEVVGVKHYVKLEYIGGFVLIEVDPGFAETLKIGSVGMASVQMEPSMSGRSVSSDKGNFAFIDTGFDNFKLVGFEPNKK